MFEPRVKNGQTDLLMKALLSLESTDEAYRFFEDLCTIAEIKSMAQRIASSISEGVSALFYILYTRYRTDWRRYKFRFTGFDFSLLKQILSLSVWVMIQQGVAFLAWFLFFLCIEHLGHRAIDGAARAEADGIIPLDLRTSAEVEGIALTKVAKDDGPRSDVVIHDHGIAEDVKLGRSLSVEIGRAHV